MEILSNPLFIGIVASANVFIGGFFVLKFKKYFNTILGFAGGVMLSVVFFEVLPEIIHIHEETELPILIPMLSVVVGILFFHLLSYFFPLHEHGHHEEHQTHDHHNHLKKGLGIYGAIIMIGHSFIDGLGIGLAFQVSTSVGFAVALAVIMHNFSDGINTISTLLHSGYNNFKIKFIFLLNILAPISGVLISQIFSLSELALFIYLGVFSGSILYLAISDILPHAHADKNKLSPILATFLGVIFVLIVTQTLGTHSH
jgi:ZIP family zinc transporter